MSTILETIVMSKRTEVDRAKGSCPAGELLARLKDAPPPRDFAAALRGGDEIRLIAEIKRASPSAGLIRQDFDPVQIAKIYETHGASAVSVLTDAPFFQGSLQYLRDVRQAVSVPLLRKDFIIDEYQVAEARVHGADAVLLIAEILNDAELAGLAARIHELGMVPLVELYDPENLERVLACGAEVVGINNRNLRTFVTDLGHTIELAPRVDSDRILVSESGIRNRDDVQTLRSAGTHAILVGETLMRAPDIGQKISELLGRE